MDKLYVDMVVRHPDYSVVTLLGMPKDDADKKARLNELIEQKSAELPEPDASNLEEYARKYDKTITPLRKELKAITGFRLVYVVNHGEYKAGQVLDRIPEGAVPFEDAFPAYEEDFSDVE